MNTTIWKYNLTFTSRTLDLPLGYKILSVQLQHERLVLWAQVNPNAPGVPTKIEVVCTGEPMDDTPREYLSTVQYGEMVLHVFKVL